jgi:transposase InsO family protein
VHQIWSIDFTMFQFMGTTYSICVVFEVYSQSYLAVNAAETPTKEQAAKAVKDAVNKMGRTPKEYLLSDNGAQFIAEDFQTFLNCQNIQQLRIPPGQPWYNGALESGNRDLKKTIYAILAEQFVLKPELSKPQTPMHDKYQLLKTACQQALTVINEEIPRTKFEATPQNVLDNKVDKEKQKMDTFRRKKQAERRNNAEKIKKGIIKVKNKNFVQKIIDSWSKIAPFCSTEQLYATKEQLNGRYGFMKV